MIQSMLTRITWHKLKITILGLIYNPAKKQTNFLNHLIYPTTLRSLKC